MFMVPLSRTSALATRRAPVSFASVVDRLFDDSFDRFIGNTKALAESRTPAMDVSESDTGYTVVLDVPGATRDELKVSVEGRRLTLSSVRSASVADAAPAEAKADGESAAAATDAPASSRVLYRERSAVAYARTVVLPAEVDQTASQAKFENGVLTLTLAKKVPAGASQIAIG